ncbi:MAG: hypothetical protein ACRDQA_26280, partial [Nocardioidaceae bacterium]
MGRLVVIVTSPRLPAGLLNGAAWRAISSASRLLCADLDAALPHALRADGFGVEAVADATAAGLVRLAADADVVWLAADEDDVVRRAACADGGPEVEVLVGSSDPAGARLLDLVAVMERLRRECPWDQQQTHESLVRYLVEETYETIDAIEG